eukprot:1145469-Pelagomonas_calceolata.AAC.4
MQQRFHATGAQRLPTLFTPAMPPYAALHNKCQPCLARQCFYAAFYAAPANPTCPTGTFVQHSAQQTRAWPTYACRPAVCLNDGFWRTLCALEPALGITARRPQALPPK